MQSQRCRASTVSSRCAESLRRQRASPPAISTCEGRRRRNVLSAWNVVSSSSATGLSPVVHPPSRPTDLQSPQRTSVETCQQTRHGEHVVENRSLKLKGERDHHAGRPSCNGHGLNPPRTLPVSRPVIHAHRGEHHRSGRAGLPTPSIGAWDIGSACELEGVIPQDQYCLPCAWERQERATSVRFVRMNYFGPTTHTTSLELPNSL